MDMTKLHFQLAQVKDKLHKHPDSKVLKDLSDKLERLIQLSERKSETVDTEPEVTPTTQFAIGSLCEVLHSGKWTPATVQSVTKQSYTVSIVKTMETLHKAPMDIREHRPMSHPEKSDSSSSRTQQSSASGKRMDAPNKAKLAAIEERNKIKDEEHKKKQESWLSFTKKMGRSK